MVGTNVLESSQSLRELDHRLASDLQSAGRTRARATELKIPDVPTMSAADPQNLQQATTDTSRNLRPIEKQPKQDPLDHIANLVLGLRYGQMIELCEAMWRGLPDDNAPVTKEKLPALLHRWAISHASASR